jgi:hypothetical protein
MWFFTHNYLLNNNIKKTTEKLNKITLKVQYFLIHIFNKGTKGKRRKGKRMKE